MGVLAIFLSLLLILIRETNPTEVIYFQSLKDQYLFAKGIFQNKNLKQLSIILLLVRIGLAPMESAAPLYFVKSGISRETLSKIATMGFPLLLIVTIGIGKFMLGRKKEIFYTLKGIRV